MGLDQRFYKGKEEVKYFRKFYLLNIYITELMQHVGEHRYIVTKRDLQRFINRTTEEDLAPYRDGILTDPSLKMKELKDFVSSMEATESYYYEHT